jgi:hypothetical protein
VTKKHLKMVNPVQGDTKAPLPPLKIMLTSVPVIALFVVQACYNWGYYTLMSSLPTYLYDVQGMSLEQASIIIGQEEFVTCSSDYTIRCLAIK